MRRESSRWGPMRRRAIATASPPPGKSSAVETAAMRSTPAEHIAFTIAAVLSSSRVVEVTALPGDGPRAVMTAS